MFTNVVAEAQRKRWDWIKLCLMKAGIDIDELQSYIRRFIEQYGSNMTNEEIDSYVEEQVKRFYKDYGIYIVCDPSYGLELLFVKDILLGVWKNEIGTQVNYEAVKNRVRQILMAKNETIKEE